MEQIKANLLTTTLAHRANPTSKTQSALNAAAEAYAKGSGY